MNFLSIKKKTIVYVATITIETWNYLFIHAANMQIFPLIMYSSYATVLKLKFIPFVTIFKTVQFVKERDHPPLLPAAAFWIFYSSSTLC